MSILNLKRNKKKEEPKKLTVVEMKNFSTSDSSNVKFDAGAVLVSQRITEKASAMAENNVYVFEISNSADKRDVARAFTALYKKDPTKVRIVKIPSKNVFVRGKWGRKKGGKKAYVYLTKGEKVEII